MNYPTCCLLLGLLVLAVTLDAPRLTQKALVLVNSTSTTNEHTGQMINLRLGHRLLGNYRHILAGDSIISRWKNLNSWNYYCGRHGVFNAGISGDRIENLLWRIVDGGESGSIFENFALQSDNSSLLQGCPVVFAYMIGADSGNIAPEDITAGIINIEVKVHEICPHTRVNIIGFLPFENASFNTVNRLLSNRYGFIYSALGNRFISMNHYGFRNDKGSINTELFDEHLRLNEAGYHWYGRIVEDIFTR